MPCVRTLDEEWGEELLTAGALDSSIRTSRECGRPSCPTPTSIRASKPSLRRVASGFRLWEGFRLKAEAFLPAEDKVVVLVVLRGKGKGSGAEVATPAAHVWTMRRGKAIRVAAYMDRAKALEAAGLSE